MAVDTIKKCFVIGDPVEQSLSPIMHSAAYTALGIEKEFNFSKKRVTPASLRVFLSQIDESTAGVSVTIPHKVSIIELLDEISDEARIIGAVNTVTFQSGKLYGTNTDWHGIVNPIKKIRKIEGARALVLGAGGAARAAVYGLRLCGAVVCIANRNLEKASALKDEFALESVFKLDAAPFSEFDIILNTTSLGMPPHADVSPVPANALHAAHLVFDAVYNPLETQLLTDAHAAGCAVLSGLEMFVEQGARQFFLYTGKEAPLTVMRESVLKRLLNDKS